MTSKRRPPSQRDPAYAMQRLSRAVQSMSPGTMGGRVANASPVASSSAAVLASVAGGGGSFDVVTEFLPAFSNTGALAVAAGTHRLYIDNPCTIVSVRAAVGSAPTGSSAIIDVNKNGTSIFTTASNKPTILPNTFTDLADAVDVTGLEAGDYLTVDIDQVGSSTTGADLTVTIEVIFEGATSTDITIDTIVLDAVIKQGPVGIATNVFPAGMRVPADMAVSGWILRCNLSGTPSGGPCTVAIKNMTSGTTIATVSIAANAATGTVTTTATLTKGTLLRFDITAAGTTSPAYDLAITVTGSASG